MRMNPAQPPPAPPLKHEAVPPLEQPTAEELLDESLQETFPASDPVSSTAAERAEADEATRKRRRGGKLEVVDASPPAPPEGPLFPTSKQPPR